MAKKDIHPECKEVEIVFANKAVLKTLSTVSTKNIEVEIAYPINHRAWNKHQEIKVLKKTKFSAISVAASSLVTNGTGPSAPKKTSASAEKKAAAGAKKKK